MTADPKIRSGEGRWPLAGALGLTALVVWFPFASAGVMISGALGALGGALAGHRLAAGRLRSVLPVLAAPVMVWLVFLAGRLMSRWPLAAIGPAPETVAALTDTLIITVISALIGATVAFYVARFPALRPLPAGLLVLSVAGLVAAHRGGAIHLPTALSDLAWIRGWHPGLLLALLGAACSVLACLALYRPGRARWPLMQLSLVLLAAILMLALVPELSIFHFSPQDPLGLSSREQDEEGQRRPAGSEGGGGQPRGSEGEKDPLGLTPGQGEGAREEMLPFRDEYPRNNAQAPVAVVILHDDVEPFGGAFYFRQTAFSAWNGRRLVRTYLPGADEDLFRRFPVVGPVAVDSPPDPGSRHVVETTVSLLRDHAAPPVLADGESIVGVTTADPALFRTSYRARSLVRQGDIQDLLHLRAGDPAWSQQVREHYLETPDDPRYDEIAQQAVSLLHPSYKEDPFARAVSVTLWLQENTQYSVRSKHSSASDPTASYLFGDRIGYCVHLAHAGVYLMRSLGLPARVAGGYAYKATDRAGGSTILLRSGDAHAWAEVYLQDHGWVPMDPAPPSLDPPMPEPDLDLQRLLGELARPDSSRIDGEASSEWRLPTLQQILIFLLSAVAAWALLGFAIKFWRRLAPLVARRDPKARLAMRASLDRLADLKLVRLPGETRESFARRLKGRAPSFRELTGTHLAATLGSREANPTRCLRLTRQIRRELHSSWSWTRLVGLLAPWRWTKTS